MRPTLAHILLFFSSLCFVVARTNFTQCLEDFKNDPNATGGVDFRGHPSGPAQAAGFTYETCTSRCGPEWEGFIWRDFAQLFSSWLLPWLALVGQLPLGSGNHVDDLISVIMSVGSPALAAYSLALTSLNVRSVYQKAKRCTHKGRFDVAKALVSLQQTSLELTKDDRLRVLISVDHHWREDIAHRVGCRHAWTATARISTAWVVIAFFFTLVDSFVSLDGGGDEPSEGQGVGTLWLWLLCLVVGWLWVPTFTGGESGKFVDHANLHAERGALGRPAQQENDAIDVATIGSMGRRVSTTEGRGTDIEGGAEGLKVKGEMMQENTEDVREGTDKRRGLLPGPSRDQSTASPQVNSESQRDHDHPSVSVSQDSNHSVVTLPRSIARSLIRPEGGSFFILKDLGALNRDELRFSATFNYSRIIRHLVLVDDVFGALGLVIREREKKPTPMSESAAVQPTTDPTFPPGALIAMFTAFIAALILQGGVSAAAIGIVAFTPTFGVGCRSLGYIIYTTLSIVILVLTVISTILVRITEVREERSSSAQGFTSFIAIALRRISFLLASINAVGIILISCFQFSNFVDNCYCLASVSGRGTDSYIIISYGGLLDDIRIARIVATVLSGASMAIYMFFLWFMSALPHDTDDFDLK